MSLDELTGNDTKEVIYEKVSNTEKLAAIVIKILKVLGMLILVSIAATIISNVVLIGVRTTVNVEAEKTEMLITESVGEEKYIIEIGSDGSFECTGLTVEMKEDIIDLIDFDDLEKTAESIEKYFIKLREDIDP